MNYEMISPLRELPRNLQRRKPFPPPPRREPMVAVYTTVHRNLPSQWAERQVAIKVIHT